MKAVVIAAPGQAAFRDEPDPRPGEGEVLVKVGAVGICMSDVETLRGTRPAAFVKYPVIPGHEWCGRVERLGPGATGVAVGDRGAVEGPNICRECAWCRRGETNLCLSYNELGFTLPGAFAEYVAVRADLAHPFANTLAFEPAAMAEPLACVVHGAQRARVVAGDTVVVVGPGTLGLLSVGWAAMARPSRLVVVGVDRASEGLARRMGATDYLTATDEPAARIRALTGGAGADLVFEASGTESGLPVAIDAARRGGTVVILSIVGGGRPMPLEANVFCLKDLRVHGVFAYTTASFDRALRLIESGRIDVRPLVTHTFPLREYEKAFDLLRRRPEPVVKVMLVP